MDIEAVVGQLNKLATQASEDLQARINGADINNPAKMLHAQFALQQYSVFISYESALLKNVRDMVMGIISKL